MTTSNTPVAEITVLEPTEPRINVRIVVRTEKAKYARLTGRTASNVIKATLEKSTEPCSQRSIMSELWFQMKLQSTYAGQEDEDELSRQQPVSHM